MRINKQNRTTQLHILLTEGRNLPKRIRGCAAEIDSPLRPSGSTIVCY